MEYLISRKLLNTVRLCFLRIIDSYSLLLKFVIVIIKSRELLSFYFTPVLLITSIIINFVVKVMRATYSSHPNTFDAR